MNNKFIQQIKCWFTFLFMICSTFSAWGAYAQTAKVTLQMDNVRRKHLSFRKARIKMLVSDQVAETCDACDRTEDLRVLRFSIYADFYSDRKSIKTDKTIFEL